MTSNTSGSAVTSPRTGRLVLATVVFAVTIVSCSNASGHSAPATNTPRSTATGDGSGNGAGGGGAPGAGSADSTGVPEQLLSYYKQTVHWSDCGDGFQCGSIKVPLDYTKPTGAVISIAVARKPATDQAHRIGSLLLNPGGPGGSGIDYARSANVVSSAVAAHFDLVGFDPRGVGKSAAVHCLNTSQMDTFLNVPPDPAGSAEIAQEVDQAKFFASQCGKSSASLLPYVGTINAARDMDVLRGVLGDAKLYYLGKSYGTYLGATYAGEFPRRVGRLVLDGAIDPSLTANQLNLAQATAFDASLRQFMQDCATRTDCPLGTDVDAGLAKLKTWVDGLDANPLPGDSTRKLVESLAMTGVAVAMYDQSWWPDLRAALTKAFAGDGSALLAMADVYNNRVGGQYQSNETEANFAVNCVDHPDEATSEAQVEQELPTYRKAAPFFGEMVAWSTLPCAYWPAAADTTPQKIKAPGAAPILVVGTTRDPATPYAWAQGLAEQLDGSRLLTMTGDGHTAYLRGSTCINDAVDAYLLGGTIPAAGTVCQQGH